LSGDLSAIGWDESNLIYRAALTLKQETGSQQGVEIEVKKSYLRVAGWLAVAVMRP